MRKLNSKKEQEKKQRRNQIIIGIVLVIVMFGSVFGLVTMNMDNSNLDNPNVNYRGYEFVSQGSYWYLNIGDRDYFFQYNPYEIQESFNFNSTLLPLASSGVIASGL